MIHIKVDIVKCIVTQYDYVFRLNRNTMEDDSEDVEDKKCLN